MNVHSAILKKHFEKLGFDDDFMKIYETEASDEMQNVDIMCDKLHDIQAAYSRLVIYTDFDVDGIMSSVVAYAGLSELDFNVSLFKPIPADGYGFRVKDVDDIIAEFPDVRVILTGDVGINCSEAILYAKSKGLTVLVTDHHIGDAPCDADIAVNPNQYGETYSHNGICGSYVIYKIIEAYSKRYCSPSKQADIYRLQVFSGIATISDVMPLLYENRQLVRNSVAIARYFFGYELVNNQLEPSAYSDNYSRAFVGLKKLLEYFHEKNKIKTTNDIDEQFYGFYLVPFLNSCKRMDGNMQGIYDIFFSPYVNALPGYVNMSCVETGIRYIESLSDRRKTLTAETFEALLAEKEMCVTANSKYMLSEIYISDVMPGLCGLLATRFMNMSGLPTLVIIKNDDGSYSGSGRNPGWFDFSSQLTLHNINITCRGHKEAFGVFIPDDAALNSYVNFFNNVVLAAYNQAVAESRIAADTDIVVTNMAVSSYDFIAEADLIREYLDELKSFHPFGHAFPEPRFKFIINLDTVSIKIFGSTSQHFKLITANGIEVLLFNQALDFEKLRYDNKNIDFALVCYGTFRYDNYDTAEYDNISFFCDSIGATEMI